MKIVVVQPVIPHYRVPFFNELMSHYNDICFFASSVDDIDVRSVSIDVFSYNLLGPVKSKFGVVWQEKSIGLIRSLKRNDILIVNGNPRYISTLMLIFLSRLKGVKVVWWGQGWSSKTSNISFMIRYRLMLLCDRVLLYTEKELSLLPVKKRAMAYYLNNGIDNHEIVDLRKAYDPDARHNSILFIGRVTEKSNLNLLIKVMSYLDSSVSLHVVGDGEMLKQCKGLAKDLNVDHKIVFYGALTNEIKIADIANGCKIFVYPGDVGLSLIHGMNYGLPAIIHSSVSKHMPEAACHCPGKNGETFTRGSGLELYRVIDSLLKNIEKLRFYSENNIKITTRDYNTRRMCQRFNEMVSSL
ncbi:glycosyltransferase family 1 protein [Halomonas litopenaei]|nr:glycosyltransferase family 1 protein [Halomonas litopenaei]